jgi:ribosomal-protein-alanine N-acetyltransferase
MLNGTTFEPMAPADLPEVMEIERLVFASPWTPGLFLHELKIPFSRLRLARESNGRRVLCGYVCWWVVGDEAHILNLAVRPDRRRSGIGREMVRLVLADARAANAGSVSLEVGRSNEAAQALYRSLGFHEAGLRRNYYARGEDALVMICRLDETLSLPGEPVRPARR